MELQICVIILESSETWIDDLGKIEDLGFGLEDSEDMIEDLGGDMGGLKDEVEDLEDNIGPRRLEGEIEDLAWGLELKNWMILVTEGLVEDTEGLEENIGDFKIGIDNL